LQQIKELRRSTWLNLAAVELKLQQWKEAHNHAGKVLEMDPSNVKALYRRAQALVGMQVGGVRRGGWVRWTDALGSWRGLCIWRGLMRCC